MPCYEEEAVSLGEEIEEDWLREKEERREERREKRGERERERERGKGKEKKGGNIYL